MRSADLLTALAGLGTALSLIVAIGAQNAFVLRQGLRGEQVLPVVVTCAISDLLLITAGVAGAGTLIERSPSLLTIVRIGGAAFLLAYAALALRRALAHEPRALDVDAAESEPHAAGRDSVGVTAAAAVLTALALTWLNPHVYLDTVVLLGSIAGSHGDGRWAFAAGAGLASVLWFTALGYGAALLRPLFARPTAWRVLDALIAFVMAAIAASLLLGL